MTLLCADRLLRLRAAFDVFLVAAVVIGLVGPLDLRVRHDAVAAQAAEVVELLPTARRVLFEKRRHAVDEIANDIRSDRMIEHRGSAYLHGAAAEEEVGERVVEVGDAAD